MKRNPASARSSASALLFLSVSFTLFPVYSERGWPSRGYPPQQAGRCGDGATAARGDIPHPRSSPAWSLPGSGHPPLRDAGTSLGRAGPAGGVRERVTAVSRLGGGLRPPWQGSGERGAQHRSRLGVPALPAAANRRGRQGAVTAADTLLTPEASLRSRTKGRRGWKSRRALS